jgi:hypothetical protein
LVRRTFTALVVLCPVFLVATPAEGGRAVASGCGVSEFSYAGLESASRAHGVSATIAPLTTPAVTAGHVGGWIGVGGTDQGPGGTAEWIQIGFSAFPNDQASRMYYEVTVAGSSPHYVELASRVKPGEAHRFAVLEVSGRSSWWRVWVDNKPVSDPIYLPGSHGAWYPQAVAESWNGGVGACNAYKYRFSNIKLAHANGGHWLPLKGADLYQDAGYRVIETSHVPRSFFAQSLS